MSLTCPKCGGQMRSYERNGVTIDQSTECRGVSLDRGELERLIDAQAAYEGQADGGSAPSDTTTTIPATPAAHRIGPAEDAEAGSSATCST